MKKILLQVLVILLILNANTFTVNAASRSNNVVIQNARAEINAKNQVLISGNISSGRGQLVTVVITDSSNKIKYCNSMISTEAGAFNFIYALTGTETGTYKVNLSGFGVRQLTTVSFESSPSTEGRQNEATGFRLSDISALTSNSDVVISGKINTKSKKQITLVVTDANQNLVFVNSKNSNKHGEYSFTLPMSGRAAGTYKIKLSGQGVINSVISSFAYGLSSNDAELLNLLFRSGSWEKEISIDNTECTINVPTDINYITIMSGTSDVCAKVKIANQVIKGWEETNKIALSMGKNMILLSVKAADGITINNYNLNIVRGNYLSNVSAKINENKLVTISGTVNSLLENDIVVMVTDYNQKKEYINSVGSTNDGSFTVSYTMQNETEGLYRVKVGGTQVIEPVITYFEYALPRSEPETPPEPAPTLYSITVGVEEKHFLTPNITLAAAGTTITLTNTNPQQGATIHYSYILEGESIEIDGDSFVMPAGNIEVRASYHYDD